MNYFYIYIIEGYKWRKKGLSYDINLNYGMYIDGDNDYKVYFKTLISLMEKDDRYEEQKGIYEDAFERAIILGPQRTEEEMQEKMLILMILDSDELLKMGNNIDYDYGKGYFYEKVHENQFNIENARKLLKDSINANSHSEYDGYYGGNRRNKASPKPKAKPKHDDMTMKDIKEMCKANQIKLSKVVEGKRVAFKKKELITKLKRKKLL